MSLKDAELLLEKTKVDEDFLKEIQSSASSESFEKTAQEAGFFCTKDEVREVVRNTLGGGNLSVTELNNISGGCCASSCAYG